MLLSCRADPGRFRRLISIQTLAGDDRAHAGRESQRLRPGGDRPDGNIQRFLEKPKPDEITCNTIKPASTCSSRHLRSDPEGRAVVDRAELLSRRSSSAARRSSPTFIAATGSTSARRRNTCRSIATSWTDVYGAAVRRTRGAGLGVAEGAGRRRARCSKGRASSTTACVVKAGARIGPYTRRRPACHVEEARRRVERAIVWADTRISQEASSATPFSAAIATSAATPSVEDGVVLGDKSIVTDYSRLNADDLT